MTVYTHAKPPQARGEDFKKPSLTDQLADEPIETVVRRFMQNPYIPGNSVDSDLVVDENNPDYSKVQQAFEDGALEDVTRLDRIERAEIVAEAERLVEQLRTVFPQATVKRESPKAPPLGVVTDEVPPPQIKDKKSD